MKKALRIITVGAGLVSAVSAVILGCIYLEGAAGQLKGYAVKGLQKINAKRGTERQ